MRGEGDWQRVFPPMFRLLTLRYLVRMCVKLTPLLRKITLLGHLHSQSSEKTTPLKAVIDDEDVKCCWHMLALYIKDDVAELLHAIVDL